MTTRNETPARLPVLFDPAGSGRTEGRADPAPRADARFAAQLLGAPGERRGLRGGPAVLNAAQAAYLHTQWAGVGDRRVPSGALTQGRI